MARKGPPQINESDIRRLRTLYHILGSANQNERDTAFAHTLAVLKRFGKTWGDLLDIIAVPSAAYNVVSDHDRKRLREQHELLGGSPEDREAARSAILWILERYRYTWNDLLGIISVATNFNPQPIVMLLLPVPTAPDPIELLIGFIPQFCDMSEDEYLVVALWTLHLYFFQQFKITPRLVLSSPVPGCGKSTVLEIIELLGKTPLKTDGITPAAIYHLIDSEKRALLGAIKRAVMLKCGTRLADYYYGNENVPVLDQTHVANWAVKLLGQVEHRAKPTPTPSHTPHQDIDITTRKRRERAILRAVHELGLIDIGEPL